ncbi:MAG: 50S ribosomal protein L11 methyltransferase [Thiobacillaceae bacterium]
MPWQSIRINVNAKHAEALSDALIELGALSVSLEDADAGTLDETPLFDEPNQHNASLWDSCVAVALLHQDDDPAVLLYAAANKAGLDQLPQFTTEPIAERDWVRLTQSQFEPIRVSARLWVVPSWHRPPDESAINIKLDPGLAFGTGSHPTTRLCLRWLDANIKGGESVLDYGCGSGILAIAAAKFNATKIWGVDIDPQALESARYNAMQNDVVAEFYLPDTAPNEQADILVANILTNPLMAMAPRLASLVRPGGRLVMSGILDSQVREVESAYHAWFNFEPPVFDEGWTRIAGVRQ